MRFHDELNPVIWDKDNDNQMRPEVLAKLKEIANAFIEYIEIPEDAVLDKVITGSSASYNYNEFSDLDLHIIVDYDKVHEDCPLVNGYLNSLKKQFNDNHDIFIHGVPVELYAEQKDQGTVHNGLYSLQTGWIDKPQKIAPTDNDAAVEAKYNEIKELVDKCDDSEEATELLEKIYNMRKAGLAEAGEFCTENLAFKKLRNEGCMDKLRQIKKEQIDKQLSLESYNESLQSEYKQAFDLLMEGENIVGTLDTDFGKQFVKDVENLYKLKSYKLKLSVAKEMLRDIQGYLVDEQYDEYNAKIDKFMNNSKNESINEVLELDYDEYIDKAYMVRIYDFFNDEPKLHSEESFDNYDSARKFAEFNPHEYRQVIHLVPRRRETPFGIYKYIAGYVQDTFGSCPNNIDLSESIKESFNKGDKVQLKRKNNKKGIVKSIFNGDKDKNDKDIKYLDVEFEDGTKEGRPASDFKKVNESIKEELTDDQLLSGAKFMMQGYGVKSIEPGQYTITIFDSQEEDAPINGKQTFVYPTIDKAEEAYNKFINKYAKVILQKYTDNGYEMIKKQDKDTEFNRTYKYSSPEAFKKSVEDFRQDKNFIVDDIIEGKDLLHVVYRLVNGNKEHYCTFNNTTLERYYDINESIKEDIDMEVKLSDYLTQNGFQEEMAGDQLKLVKELDNKKIEVVFWNDNITVEYFENGTRIGARKLNISDDLKLQKAINVILINPNTKKPFMEFLDEDLATLEKKVDKADQDIQDIIVSLQGTKNESILEKLDRSIKKALGEEVQIDSHKFTFKVDGDTMYLKSGYFETQLDINADDEDSIKADIEDDLDFEATDIFEGEGEITGTEVVGFKYNPETKEGEFEFNIFFEE